jgi:hypothetical protein
MQIGGDLAALLVIETGRQGIDNGGGLADRDSRASARRR